jgi:RNA polymerase sigma-70 factor (ECF subfamily)
MAVTIDLIVQTLLRERLRLVAVAVSIVRDVHTADDVFQQVVLAALEHRDQIRDQEHLLSWAVRVTRHRAVDQVRRKQAQTLPTHILDLLEASWGNPAGSGEPDQVEALRRCVDKLGAPSRELLRLKYFDGLATPDLADRLRRSVDAVYQSLSRIHRTLSRCVHRELGITEATEAEADREQQHRPPDAPFPALLGLRADGG